MPLQPEPSPSPTPQPVAAIKIKGINLNSLGAMIEPEAQFPNFQVSEDYLTVCEPVPGGYYVVYTDAISFLSNEDFAEKFPQ